MPVGLGGEGRAVEDGVNQIPRKMLPAPRLGDDMIVAGEVFLRELERSVRPILPLALTSTPEGSPVLLDTSIATINSSTASTVAMFPVAANSLDSGITTSNALG